MRDDETVRDVCDIIRMRRLDLFRTYDEIANRILASHEREIAAKDAEIARLKTALKPVMECDLTARLHIEPNEDRLLCIGNTENAVREAQRVMRKSSNGEIHN